MRKLTCARLAVALILSVIFVLSVVGGGGALADNRERPAEARSIADGPSVTIAADYSSATCCGRGARFAAVVEPGTAPEPLSYAWSGPGLAEADRPEAVVADSLAPGTYIYRVKVTGADGSVSEEATETLTVLEGPTCSIDGPGVVCPASVTTYCGPSGGSTYYWTVGGAATIVGPATNQCVDVRASSVCVREFTLNLRVSGDDPTCPTSCNKRITILDLVAPEITCPPDITVECAATADPAITGSATATDACDPSPDITYSDEVVPGTCPVLRTVTRTWRAADDCGNSATCVQTISMVDGTAPVVTCPGSVTVGCWDPTDPAYTGYATATDNCDGQLRVDYSDNVHPGDCPQAYLIERTWSATDQCGNEGYCIQSISVVDTVAPEVTCAGAVRVDCIADLPAPDISGVIATDNCDPNPRVDFGGDSSDGRSCPETISRTYLATDACGNTSSCVQTIIVWDATPPTITCPNDTTIDCGDPRDPDHVGRALATDNCDPSPYLDYTDDVRVTTDPCGVLVLRNWSAVDGCDNRASCTQRITCIDTTAPQFASTPAPSLTVDCGRVPPPPDLDALDACDPDVEVTFEERMEPGACGGEYTLIRTWTASDDCDHWTDFVQTISVIDTLAPEFTTPCPVDVTVNCNQVPGAADMEATDLCIGSARVVFDERRVDGSCPSDYRLVRTWTAADNCGNYTQCVQTVTVVDTPPEITCPDDVTVECGDPIDPQYTGFPRAGDACGEVEVDYHDRTEPGTSPGSYRILRTWVAVDDCANADSCVQTLTVYDDDPPRIDCPPDLTLECGRSTHPDSTGYATAEDDCDEEVVPTYTDVRTPGPCPQSYTIARTWLATDGAGNSDFCVQTITVIDTTPPVITCPADVRLECSASTDPDSTGWAAAVDNCDPDPGVDYEDFILEGACRDAYVIERTWTAADACNNQAGCLQRITVVDDTPPVIVCPGDTTVSCTGSTSPEITGYATADDNCAAEIGVGYDDRRINGPCPQAYSIERTWSTEDDCGNTASCVQRINVVDLSPPDIYCPSNVTVQCGDPTDPGHTGYATAWDSCDTDVTPTYADVIVGGTQSQSYDIRRTWTATDDCGNWSDCVQTITVIDTEPPRIVCPPEVNVECGQPTDPDHTGRARADDDCDYEVAVTWSDRTTPGSCPQALTITRMWRAEDNAGNVATCDQVIRVVDDRPPVVTCPGDRTFECGATIEFGSPTVSDNCDPAPVVAHTDVVIPGSSPQSYSIRRTWTATDACGNAGRCVQTVSVLDRTGPVLTTPEDQLLLCGQPVVFTDPQITDNCDREPVLTVVSNDVAPGPETCQYTYTRCWRGRDASGNFSQVVCQHITRYEDEVPPVLSCAPDKEIEPGQPVVFDEPQYSDNCYDDGQAPPQLSSVLTTAVALQETSYTRCWLAFDLCGNQSNECCQTITVRDEPPSDPYCSFVCWNWTAACLTDPYNHEISTPPACLRDEHFSDVFPHGVTIGTHASPGLFTATWTSPGAVERFKCGYGLPDPLHRDWVDPRNTDLGALEAEVLTLRLNRGFSCAGYFEAYGYPLGQGCFGEFVLPPETIRFAGLTVDQFLAVADRAVAGDKSALLPYGYSYSRLHSTAAYANWLFAECNGFGTREQQPPGILGVDGDTGREPVGDRSEALPERLSVTGDPNPMRDGVTIHLALPADGDVSLDIYDVQGRVVASLVNEHKQAGCYSVTWDGRDAAGSGVVSGIYFCRVQVDGRLAAMEKLMKL